jgi:hypothetical protein
VRRSVARRAAAAADRASGVPATHLLFNGPRRAVQTDRRSIMNRYLAAAFAASLMSGAGAAMAQTPAVPSTPTKAIPTHPVRDLQGDPATKALNLLEASGYATFTQFHQVGDHYEAVAMKDGKPITVSVDPATGQVRT